MRILFTTYPDKPIFQPMVPLAWALRTAGHEVRVASQPEFTDHITQAGLTAVPVGRNRHTWRMAELDTEVTEEERPGLPEPFRAAVTDPAELDFAALRDGYEHHIQLWYKLDNFPMISGLLDYAVGWQPDLVLWEPNTYAGAIAAKACGAAHGRVLWSIDVFGVARERYLRLNEAQPDGERHDPMAQWLGPYARRHGDGFTEDLVTGQFTIDQLPPSLSMRADLHYLPMRYIPYNGRAALPAWLRKRPDRPRVALTLGVTATDRFAGYAADVGAILASLADLDIEVVATIAEAHHDRLGAVPDNVRLIPFAPLHDLAATCSVVINHAGPGTFLTTAANAVPQLTVPWDFDEPELARRAAAQGGSLTVPANLATGEAVRGQLQRLLSEEVFADRACALRAEMKAMPSPNELVGQLEELTAKHRTAGT
ncbi:MULTISPECIES: activator-dependent family glycosyltransferase [unclassified Micromonospora]|uniref:activator-dependent family glycosyltransferase n=1 Tax=unclassified Micromonospora TaxID=2617518 RepID=UPI0010336339|nr:activator-dependent family glycosyltransferase [Verrucosispora sp. SN26_14.1]TBL45475.1 activator-dependent family glycosyltransferase [Verrucosispora sp. SN26_14.1]